VKVTKKGEAARGVFYRLTICLEKGVPKRTPATVETRRVFGRGRNRGKKDCSTVKPRAEGPCGPGLLSLGEKRMIGQARGA